MAVKRGVQCIQIQYSLLPEVKAEQRDLLAQNQRVFSPLAQGLHQEVYAGQPEVAEGRRLLATCYRVLRGG